MKAVDGHDVHWSRRGHVDPRRSNRPRVARASGWHRPISVTRSVAYLLARRSGAGLELMKLPQTTSFARTSHNKDVGCHRVWNGGWRSATGISHRSRKLWSDWVQTQVAGECNCAIRSERNDWCCAAQSDCPRDEEAIVVAGRGGWMAPLL